MSTITPCSFLNSIFKSHILRKTISTSNNKIKYFIKWFFLTVYNVLEFVTSISNNDALITNLDFAKLNIVAETTYCQVRIYLHNVRFWQKYGPNCVGFTIIVCTHPIFKGSNYSGSGRHSILQAGISVLKSTIKRSLDQSNRSFTTRCKQLISPKIMNATREWVIKTFKTACTLL